MTINVQNKNIHATVNRSVADFCFCFGGFFWGGGGGGCDMKSKRRFEV